MGALPLWGRVFDELGSPLGGVSVSAYEWNPTTEERSGVPAATTTTNSKGIWTFATLDETKLYEVVVALASGPQRVVVGGARAQWRSLTVLENVVVGGLVDGVDVSAHQHTGAAGQGAQIPTAGLQDGAVTTAKLGDGQVTAAKVAADVATQAELDGHAAQTTNVHGVGASTVESVAGSQAKADAVQANLNAHKSAATLDHPDGSVTDAKVVSVSGGKVTGAVASAVNADTLDGQHASAFAPAAKGVTNGDSHDHSGGDGAQIQHSSLGGVTADQHHPKAHAHNGSDGSGTVAHANLTGIGADDHHAKVHNHTSAAEGGTINVPKEVVVPLGHAQSYGWDGANGDHRNWGHGQYRFYYLSARYPNPTTIVFRAGGRSEGSGGTCEVQLYNYTDLTPVNTIQLPATGGGGAGSGPWNFSENAVMLASGKEYVVRVHNTDGSKLAEGSGAIIFRWF